MKYVVQYKNDLKYVVQYKNDSCNVSWFEDEVFDNLPDAIEYASRECRDNPRFQHRIVKVYDVEQVMFFPAIEEVTND